MKEPIKKVASSVLPETAKPDLPRELFTESCRYEISADASRSDLLSDATEWLECAGAILQKSALTFRGAPSDDAQTLYAALTFIRMAQGAIGHSH
jgi:hypothetical protein